jgi:diguanylate cyclase (GGDEF)-like protein
MNALITEQLEKTSHGKLALEAIVEPCLSVPSDRPAIAVLDLFLGDRNLRVIPVVDNGIPVGMLNRQIIVEMFSRPFRRDLFGKRPVRDFMDGSPIIVQVSTDIDDLAQTLVAAGLQQMLDGFLVVGTDGDYVGIGNAQNLLSEITKRKQAHLYQLAHFDALTGLPNRILFRDRLQVALSHEARARTKLAVLLLDVDHFKRINDTLGHPLGDELLQGVAGRLAGSVRRCDTLSRMGGDEFTLVLTDLACTADVLRIVRKLRDRLHEPMRINGQEMLITASIGIAIFPDDGHDMDELIRKADIALYASKHAGRDTYSFFDPKHQVFDDSRLYLESELRTGLKTHQIRPAFQALVDVQTGVIAGVEALARWTHPAQGEISPDVFVPLAEDTGLIQHLGKTMTRQSGLAFSELPGAGKLRLSLNVSILELRSAGFVDSLLQTISSCGLSPVQLQLEITERLFLEPSTQLLQQLERLRTEGIRIAIDDFGIGSTSLRLLHQLPVDVLKIDRAFISALDHDARMETLVQAIIDMGHAMDLLIVAEGVETERQAQLLRDWGCDYLQGFLFCRPMPVSDFADWLRQHRSTIPK